MSARETVDPGIYKIDPNRFFNDTLWLLDEPQTLGIGETAQFVIDDSNYHGLYAKGLMFSHPTSGNYFLERRAISREDNTLTIIPGLIQTIAELPEDVVLDQSHLSDLCHNPNLMPPLPFKHKPVVGVVSYHIKGSHVFNIRNAQLPERIPEIHHPIVVAPVRIQRSIGERIKVKLALGS